MPFLLALTLLFIALKLTGFIAWSWWLVLSPILIIVLLAICFIAGGIAVFKRFFK